MKRIYNIVIVAIFAILTSCDDFLEKYPTYAVDPDAQVTDSMAIALTNSCYKALQSLNMYNLRLWGLDIIAGNSEVGAGGGTDGIETIQAANFTTLSNNEFALDIWRSSWVGIGRCNIILSSIPSSDITESLKNRCLGEAYFIRAHCYYILVRLYGGVPLRLEPYDPGTSTAIARESVEDIYEQIISDCNKAIELLPEKRQYDDKNVGRACKEAAMTMLADVYLTLAPDNNSCYSNVVSLCNQISDLGYDLSKCKYEDNFNDRVKNNPESIFEIQYSGNSHYGFLSRDMQSSLLSPFMGPSNSKMVAGAFGWNLPTQEFMDQYEEGDLRKDITAFYDGCPDFEGIPYKSIWSKTGYNVRKFLVSTEKSDDANTSPEDFVVYRYADVLLKKAEALNEEGKTADAVVPLNIVRHRAGLKDIPSSISKADLHDIIIHERRMELAFEAHRWFDMIRIDHGNYALSFLKSIGKTNVTKDRLLLPIPQTEIDSNPLMTQNPGY